MYSMLINISHMVNVEKAQCAVLADLKENLRLIRTASADRGGFEYVNKRLQGAITAGLIALQAGIAAVDNFMCGEYAALRMLPVDKVYEAVCAACAAGLVEVVQALLDSEEGAERAAEARRVVVENFYPLWTAAGNGRIGVVDLLLGVEGVDVNRGHSISAYATPLYAACFGGHLAVVERLLAHPATVVNQVNKYNRTPLYIASSSGNLAVVKVLLEKGADKSIKDKWDRWPLSRAEANGHGEVAALLRGWRG